MSGIFFALKAHQDDSELAFLCGAVYHGRAMDETSELTDVEPEESGRVAAPPEATIARDEADERVGADGAPTPITSDADVTGRPDGELGTAGDGDGQPVGEAESPARNAAEAATEPATPAPHEPEVTVESVIEALLFATDSPLPAARVAQLIGVGDARDVKKHIQALNERYERNGNAFRIEAIARGYQMLTLPAYNGWVRKLIRVRDESKLSPAAMETLAIVAYKQPVLRADVETIRGVACGELLNRLREMNLIKIVGRAEEVGRPMLYGTTNHFLKVFGLGTLADLPGTESLPSPPERPEATVPAT